jgi:hypothetical protein
VLESSNRLHPVVPKALAAKCFPALQHGGSQSVQLYISLLSEDATDSTLLEAGKTLFLVWFEGSTKPLQL